MAFHDISIKFLSPPELLVTNWALMVPPGVVSLRQMGLIIGFVVKNTGFVVKRFSVWTDTGP